MNVAPLNLQFTQASFTQSPGLRHTHGLPGTGGAGPGGGGGGPGGGKHRPAAVQRFAYAVQSPLGTAESFDS